MVPVGEPNMHAEIKVVDEARYVALTNGGYQPIDIYASNNQCGNCSAYLEALGAIVYGPLGNDQGSKYAYWPSTRWP